MYRPWDEDDAPVWSVHCRRELLRPPRVGDEELLTSTLLSTGLVRRPSVALCEDRGLSVALLVRADNAQAAGRIACRVLDVAHRVAGLGALGRHGARSVVRHPRVAG